MLQFMQYNINQCDASKGETYRLTKEFGQKLIDNTREVIGKPPMYKDSCGSALIIVPFNQASKQDVEALVDYIYSNLGMDLDYILPFVGIIPENGREIDKLDNKSELTHRVMLINFLRILGAVKNKKASRQFITRPTQVILPLSLNHSLFKNNGFYSESKISLETLFHQWASESWGECLCLAGAVIG